jgi:hypothetical protein
MWLVSVKWKGGGDKWFIIEQIADLQEKSKRIVQVQSEVVTKICVF